MSRTLGRICPAFEPRLTSGPHAKQMAVADHDTSNTQVEDEVRRAGKIETAEDADAILPVLSGWLAVLHDASPTPEKHLQHYMQQGVEASRPRWRQPPLVVWNALCVLLPQMAAPAMEHTVEEIQDLVMTVVTAATDCSQYQCASLQPVCPGTGRSARPLCEDSRCNSIAA